MTTSVIRLALTTLAFTAAFVGCTPMEKKSTIRDTITKAPDAAFLKKVQNDPFPAAGQAPKTQATTAADVAEHRASVQASTNLPTPLSAPRAGVLGQSNITAGTGGPVGPTTLARMTATASDDDATATATDEVPPTASPTATATASATTALARPLPARNNIRPLNRPLNGATRRN